MHVSRLCEREGCLIMNKEEMIKKVAEDKFKNISVTKPFLKNKLNLP